MSRGGWAAPIERCHATVRALRMIGPFDAQRIELPCNGLHHHEGAHKTTMPDGRTFYFPGSR